jgi:hypothetical protein
MPDQERFFQVQYRKKGGNVAAEVLDRALVRTARRPAMAAQVAGDYFVRGLEEVELKTPVFVAAAEAMDENERRLAAPGVDVMQGPPG